MSDENNEIKDELKKKIFFSNLSDAEVIVVDSCNDLTEEQLKDESKAFFDGMTLIDNAAEVEDDISQVCSLTKDRKRVNLQDYYSDNGAYDDYEQFLEAIQNLMDKDYYISEEIDFCECDDLEDDEEEEDYPCDEDGNAIFEENITEIKEDLFMNCDSLITAVIPEGVKIIGKGAFWGAHNLSTLIIPEGVEIIKEEAFFACFSLEEVILPKSLKTIENSAFFNCKNLKRVILQSGLKTIGNEVFQNCKKLKNIAIPDSVKKIGNSVFKNTGIKTLDTKFFKIQNGLCISLDNKQLLYCSCDYQKEIVIPEGIVSIESCVFSNCEKVTTVIIPDTVESMEEGAFFRSPITSIRIPKRVTSIKYETFSGCEKLKEIEIPAGVLFL